MESKHDCHFDNRKNLYENNSSKISRLIVNIKSSEANDAIAEYMHSRKNPAQFSWSGTFSTF